MPYLNDRVLDLGLNVLDVEATTIHICSAEPSTFAGVASVSLGSAAVTIGAPAARTPNGRKVTVAAISNGTVTAATPTAATHYAITDTANSRLLAAATLTASQTVTSGNGFNLSAFDIGIPGAV